MIKKEQCIDFKVTEFDCPLCKAKLVSSQSDKDRGVWCGKCENEGVNGGAYAKTDKEAYEILRGKMGLDKK